MFLETFKITSLAVFQIFLLGAIGFFLAKKDILGEAGLNILSRLVVEITLPLLIFCQLIKDFRFDLYPNWWMFPLASVAITILGFLIGYIFTGFIKGPLHKMQFLSLVSFQNSGYLPIALIAALLPKYQANTMFIYLFMFLLGFNLIVWSLGVYMLSFHENKKFEMGSLFSPPVIATLVSLLVVFLNLNMFIPNAILRPLRLVGDCTLPLAMFIVGGSLAFIKLKHIDKKAIFFVLLVKLIILPVLGLLFILRFNLPELIGLLIIMELAVPPATSLSVITRHYKKEDLLISQGVLFGHLLSLITLPVFLSLYYIIIMVK